MRIILAPDSYKGSFSSPEVAAAMARGLHRVLPAAELIELPLADGGEGTLEAVLMACGGRRLAIEAMTVAGQRCPVDIGLVREADGVERVVIESALLIGLHLAPHLAVSERSTVGLGDLIAACVARGWRRFAIGLGGSGTNDGGAGLLQGLGARLLDRAGAEVLVQPARLNQIASVDLARARTCLAEVDMQILCDVINPLCGPNGATATFGPQKGVQAAEVAPLDAAIARFAALCEGDDPAPLAQTPGAGAAGGAGYALQLLGGYCTPGGKALLQLADFDALVAGADWVLSGEGRSDRQTLQGKLPAAVAEAAARHGVATTLLSGGIERAAREPLGEIFQGAFSIADGPLSLEEMQRDGLGLIEEAAAELARLRYRI
ncbi:MAG TPA: glycerate kinase [Rhodocyclaceae bacterium]